MLAFVFIISIILSLQQQKVEQMLFKSKLEIQQNMSKLFPDYTTNNFGIKANDNTLRYYNAKKDATLIFYFNKQNKCKHIKIIEDIDNLEQRIKELNAQYKRVAENKWKASIEQNVITITIEKEEYNFSVIYQ